MRDYFWRGSNAVTSVKLAASRRPHVHRLASPCRCRHAPDLRGGRWRTRRRIAADVVKQGFAYGYVTDYANPDEADAQALKKCRDTTIEGVRPLCTVIQDFKNQCVAVAMDPQAGTPGVGWAVAASSHTAEAQALGSLQPFDVEVAMSWPGPRGERSVVLKTMRLSATTRGE